MAKNDLEPEDIERKVLDLAKAMERTRSAQAERDDVVVEMKHAKMSRLELLAEDLEPVFEALPKDNDQFEFALSNGATPRLWVDMTSFVRMAADGREYEFVKDTRLGRTVLGRSDKRDIIGENITAYVAERVLERERMIEGDWLSAKEVLGAKEESVTPKDSQVEKTDDQSVDASSSNKSSLLWFVIGIGAGFVAIWAVAEFDQIEPVVQWFRGLTTGS